MYKKRQRSSSYRNVPNLETREKSCISHSHCTMPSPLLRPGICEGPACACKNRKRVGLWFSQSNCSIGLVHMYQYSRMATLPVPIGRTKFGLIWLRFTGAFSQERMKFPMMTASARRETSRVPQIDSMVVLRKPRFAGMYFTCRLWKSCTASHAPVEYPMGRVR